MTSHWRFLSIRVWPCCVCCPLWSPVWTAKPRQPWSCAPCQTGRKNSCITTNYFISGDLTCATSTGAIWYVALMMCCKQLLCKMCISLPAEHNSNYFRWLAFSQLQFTFFSEAAHSSVWGQGALYCLTTAISHWELWSHSSCGLQVNWPVRRKEYEQWPEQMDNFLPSIARSGELGSNFKIKRGLKGAEKARWQRALLAVCKMGKGGKVPGGGNGKPWCIWVLDYHKMMWWRIQQEWHGKINFPF